MYLPVVASRIITNNVQVAFFAFAFGITAGIGTLLLLTLNGLFFGAVLGLFANYGLAGWLLTFVAGHGVLELTAIFIAGGAGLLVARGLIAPGDLTRRDALVLAGRRAARLVAAAVLLLCLAGTIEGLLSASDAAPAYKFAVSAGAADSTVHLSSASRMPRILRESASICFRLVTVSASYLSALSRSSWVSARIAARGFDRSWRSCLMGSSASTI